MTKALFLDRDGVLNYDTGYTHVFESTQIIPGSVDLIRFAKKKGFKVIIITNQSGIGRGLYSEQTFHVYMRQMISFSKKGAKIDDYFFAPYYEFSSNEIYKKGKILRKPEPGMISLASQKHNLNLSKSILLGDKISDIESGKNAGVLHLFLYDADNKNLFIENKNIRVKSITDLIDLDIW